MNDGTGTRKVAGAVTYPERLLQWLLGLSILGTALIALLPGLFFRGKHYFHDLFTMVDAIYRTQAGLHASIDYFSPIGPLQEWVFRAAMVIVPANVHVINLGSALVALSALGTCWLLLGRRGDRVVFMAASVMAVTIALSGRDPDQPAMVFNVTHLAPYNTWGWALLCPVAIFAVLPHARRAGCRGVLACGMLLAAMALIKVTYAVGGAGLIGVAVILRTLDWRDGLWMFVVTGLVLCGADLASHGQVTAYLGDLRAVAGMPESGLRGEKLLGQVIVAFLPLYAFCLALWCGLMRDGRSLGAVLREDWRGLALIGAMGGVNAFVMMQNNDFLGGPLLGLMPVAVIGWALAGKGAPASWADVWARRPEWLSVGLMTVLAVPAQNLIAVFLEILMLIAHAPDPRFAGTTYAGLTDLMHDDQVLEGNAFDRSSAQLQFGKMLDGWSLLKAQGIKRDDGILALAFTNPYPQLMQARALRYGPVWLDTDRSFSVARHVPAEALFSDVTYVMQARHDENVADLMQIYGTYLAAHYTLRAQSPEWIMWVRKP